MKLSTLTAFLDDYLHIRDFANDISNNGLQVEGKAEIHRAVFGVDACQLLFDRAAEIDADFIFVHHGLSWGANPKVLTGIEALRFGSLFRQRQSLYAAHLPLDAHAEVGNNAQLAKLLKLHKLEEFFRYDGYFIGWRGKLSSEREAAEIAAELESAFPGAPVRLLGSGKVKKVAIVSGGGGLSSVIQAHECGADLLITGELEHIMYHAALEYDLPLISLGHYASETVGPRAMLEVVRAKFDLDCRFIDLPTGL